jgi:hypothetical protein
MLEAIDRAPKATRGVAGRGRSKLSKDGAQRGQPPFESEVDEGLDPRWR